MSTSTTVDHSWLSNVTCCAFNRLYVEVVHINDERWTNAHILNRHRIKLTRMA